MSFNFKDVEVPQETMSYVKPGLWKLSPSKAELVTREGKNPYINVTFEGKPGKLTEKFYLSEKAIVRLQYLHQEMLDGKRIEKEFKNEDEIALYFNAIFSKKKMELPLIVGGSESSEGKVYANLPFLNFVVKDENFEEGAFEVGSAQYNSVVKKDTYKSPNAPTSNATVINAVDDKMPWD